MVGNGDSCGAKHFAFLLPLPWRDLEAKIIPLYGEQEKKLEDTKMNLREELAGSTKGDWIERRLGRLTVESEI